MRRIVFIIEKFVSKKKLIKYYIENIHVLVENLKNKLKRRFSNFLFVQKTTTIQVRKKS